LDDSDPTTVARVNTWVRTFRELIAHNVADFTKTGDVRKLSKWAWMRYYLELSIGRLPGERRTFLQLEQEQVDV
jgi:hypothetical protein